MCKLIISYKLDTLPPSTNAIYKRNKWGGLYLHPMVSFFRDMVRYELNKHIYNKSIKHVKIILKFHVKNKKRRDLDNLLKSVLDAMNTLLYDDDSQIHQIVCEKVEDTKELMFVEVYELE